MLTVLCCAVLSGLVRVRVCVCAQVFTITVPAEQEAAARDLVVGMSPNARLTYSVGGTLKFELPTSEVRQCSSTRSLTLNYRTQLAAKHWCLASSCDATSSRATLHTPLHCPSSLAPVAVSLPMNPFLFWGM